MEIRLSIKPLKFAIWDLIEPQKLFIQSWDKILPLPYFDPDLSDYKSLISKINTYITFQ